MRAVGKKVCHVLCTLAIRLTVLTAIERIERMIGPIIIEHLDEE
jgi:hypothetical protein